MLIDSDRGRHPVHADRLQASLPCAISSPQPNTRVWAGGSNKQHALCTLGERSLTASAIGRPSNQQSRGPTNACHFVVVVGFSWMADVPSPIPVHAPRKAPKVASKYCAGVTPDFRSGVHRCCVQPINCRFRLSGVEPSGIPIERSAPRFARK